MSVNVDRTTMRYVIKKSTIPKIGPLLRKIREDHSTESQATVSRKTNRAQSNVNNMEKIGGRLPNLNILVSYLDAIGFQVVIEQKES